MIEFRWLRRTIRQTFAGNRPSTTSEAAPVVLQFRVQRFQSPRDEDPVWTEWYDVPTTKEVRDFGREGG